MPRYDLNGDLLPDDGPSPAPAAAPVPGQGYAPGTPPQGQPYTGAPYAPQAQPYAPQYPPQGQPYAGPHAPTPPYAGGQSPPILPDLPPARSSTIDPIKVVGGIVIGTIVVVVGILAFTALYPSHVPVPAGYQTYSLDGGTTVDQPVGWTVSPVDATQGSDAAKITGGAVFRNGTAMIEFAEGTAYDSSPTAPSDKHGMLGSLVTTVLNSNAMDIPPAESTAKRYRRLAKNHLWGYQEAVAIYNGNSNAYNNFQEATFTADHPAWSIGGPVKGYFVTEADTMDSIAIVCECRASDWATLQPAFDHVISSLDNPQKRKEQERLKEMEQRMKINSDSQGDDDSQGSDTGSGDTGGTGF